MHRGFIGCFSDLELNSESINLTRYINTTNNSITPKSGPCTTSLTSKRECACEHGGECRMHTGGSWSCDCSKTGFTGRRCEHPTYHIDLSKIHTFELNTNLQWSEQINDIAFGLQVRCLRCEANYAGLDRIRRDIRFGTHVSFFLPRQERTKKISLNFVLVVKRCNAIRSNSPYATVFSTSRFRWVRPL